MKKSLILAFTAILFVVFLVLYINESNKEKLEVEHERVNFYSIIDEGDWYSENNNKSLILYNTSAESYSHIKITSQNLYASDENKEGRASVFFGETLLINQKEIDNVKLYPDMDYNFDKFDVYKFHYEGRLISEDVYVKGDYVYWWVRNKVYTCSTMCKSDEYREFSKTLRELLNNFQQASALD